MHSLHYNAITIGTDGMTKSFFGPAHVFFFSSLRWYVVEVLMFWTCAVQIGVGKRDLRLTNSSCSLLYEFQ